MSSISARPSSASRACLAATSSCTRLASAGGSGAWEAGAGEARLVGLRFAAAGAGFLGAGIGSGYRGRILGQVFLKTWASISENLGKYSGAAHVLLLPPRGTEVLSRAPERAASGA